MKTKLLKRVRKNIRITDFAFGFYDIEVYHNFKWRRQSSRHFYSDVLKDVHFIINCKLEFYRKIKKFISK
jgi:hypothetical protein